MKKKPAPRKRVKVDTTKHDKAFGEPAIKLNAGLPPTEAKPKDEFTKVEKQRIAAALCNMGNSLRSFDSGTAPEQHALNLALASEYYALARRIIPKGVLEMASESRATAIAKGSIKRRAEEDMRSLDRRFNELALAR